MTTHATETDEAAVRRYHTPAEVAVILNLGKRTVYELIAAGELTAVRMGTRKGTLRISDAALKAYEDKAHAAATQA